MAALGSLSFLFPWVLAALLALPFIWWLLRLVPPQPKLVVFPAIRFLFGLKKDEQSSATTPWWLLLLRLLVAALLILAVAHPVLKAPEEAISNGPLVLIVDDGWSAAQSWPQIRKTLDKLVTTANQENRQVYVVTTARADREAEPRLAALSDQEALGIATSLTPKSWPSDYARLQGLLPKLKALQNPAFVWLTGGIARKEATADIDAFIGKLGEMGPLTIYRAEEPPVTPIIGTPKIDGVKLEVPLTLASGVKGYAGTLTARAATGQILSIRPVNIAPGETSATVSIDVPNEVRNQISRLGIEGAHNAGAIFLLDQSWQRKEVGLVGSPTSGNAQPLLNENHYLASALSPFFDLRYGSLPELLKSDVSLIALGDTAHLPEGVTDDLRRWIAKGGILIRFAGPKLANSDSKLVPVELRSGDRSLQGAMSWIKPAKLGPVPKGSPFSNLAMPDDVRIRKQVLANPTPDLLEKTWAQLEDGTPLVTAAQTGRGWLVLFHITATPDWSNLPLSGLFVEMLREIGNLGQFGPNNVARDTPLAPFRLLDGFGALSDDTGIAEPISAGKMAETPLDARHPPGYYGSESYGIALNIGASEAAYSLIDFGAFKATLRGFEKTTPVDLMPPLLLLSFLLVLLDQLAALYLQGKLPTFRRTAAAATVFTVIFAGHLLVTGTEARAQAAANSSDDERILAATLDTRLGYVVTHQTDVDEISRAGLAGLSRQLLRRTSVEAKDPLAIDIEEDELVFYPLIYWPVTADFPPLSDAAILKIDNYFKGGGTILFDTRNQNSLSSIGGDLSGSPENIRLRRLMARLDIPRVEPVPVDHVLTRSFYLMQSFPGRYAGGELWVEDTAGNQGNDGVASILIGSNDWAAAWAVDANGNPMAATIPGTARQREMAYRFGINLVMYTLTGNYKADQVHVPAILERLGQ